MSELFPTKLIYLEAIRGAKDTEVSHMNRWYDKVWIPAVRELPGVVSVHRYIFEAGEVPEFFKALEADGRRYLTFYRLSTDDPEGTAASIRDLWEKRDELSSRPGVKCLPEQMYVAPGIEVLDHVLLTFEAMRQSIRPLDRAVPTHLPDGMPEAFVMISNSCYKKNLPIQDDWWVYTHAHDLMETPGYTQCSRFHSLDKDIDAGEVAAVNIYEIDAEDPHKTNDQNVREDVERFAQGRVLAINGPALKGMQFMGIFHHWDIASAF
ncbi:MAG: hypothetical protein J6P87_05100 [Lachnospiraceae bacterium]|nr:hypothetical protein [Lachnospiraceae bacterium]